MEPLRPPGPELAASNRRLLAQRGRWPEGAVQACEAIEADFPDWGVSYSHGGGATWVDPGYYARRIRHRHMEDYEYGSTVEEIRAAIEVSQLLTEWRSR